MTSGLVLDVGFLHTFYLKDVSQVVEGHLKKARMHHVRDGLQKIDSLASDMSPVGVHF